MSALPTYTHHDAIQFVNDMESAEEWYEVEHYHGRSMWVGPAVRIDRNELQDVIRATTVRVQWDTLGDGYIVYPLHGDPGTEGK
jgi:hypothetical protein